MRLKIFFTIAIIIFSLQVKAQVLNGYKYIIVPKKFDFQKSTDKYQLNSLTKFLFDKEDFETVFDDGKFSDELSENPCLALRSNVRENSNMFTTKLTIELINCSNQIVFTSQEGTSKQKDLKKGHHEALRNAFKSIKEQGYSFDENNTLLKKEVKTTTNSITSQVAKPVVKETVEQVEEVTTPVNTTEVVEDTIEKTKKVATPLPVENATVNVLYAQSIPNGFQLVDSTPKIVFKALKSNSENLYYLENQAGVLTKENDRWYVMYYKEGKLAKEELNIKF